MATHIDTFTYYSSTWDVHYISASKMKEEENEDIAIRAKKFCNKNFQFGMI